MFFLLVLVTLLPQSQFLLDRGNFVLNYDGRTRNACWVYEKLTIESLLGKQMERSCYHFSQDYAIPSAFRASNEDYPGSGFDRGHLCPFADLPDRCAGESFLLSNISPQTPTLNRGIWRRLESFLRKLSWSCKAIHIITLPLYLPEESGDGKRYVRYQVIGDNDVAVPTHFAKAVFLQREGQVEVQAYLLPNGAIESGRALEEFAIELDRLEKISGVLFPEINAFLETE